MHHNVVSTPAKCSIDTPADLAEGIAPLEQLFITNGGVEMTFSSTACPRSILDRRVRFAALLVLALAMALVVQAVPAHAAPKGNENKTVVHLDDPEEWAALSEEISAECGFDVVVDGFGWVQIMTFSDQRGRTQHEELNVYHSRIVASANGQTIEILDVGPDHFFVRDGVAYLALTGRSITGSGVIGHVVVNLDTGEVEFEAGNVQGDWIENLCTNLAA